jgi:Ion channel
MIESRRLGSDFRDRFRRAQYRLRDPLLTALTILLMLMLFVIAPLHAAGTIHSQNYGIAMALVLVAGVFIMSGSMLAVIALLVAIGLAIAAALLPFRVDASLDVHLEAIAWVTTGLALIWVVARAVFASGRVTYHRVVGAILLYLTIGLVFVGLFTLVGLLSPGTFSGIRVEDDPALASKFIYFSFVTLTSTGYGDIVPVHPLARSLCNLEAIIGQLYPATLLARLVTLELEGRALTPRRGRAVS